MKTFIFSFRGIYPVGAFIAVIAGNQAEAEDMATKALIHHDLDWSSLELDKVMNSNTRAVYVISDGDY